MDRNLNIAAIGMGDRVSGLLGVLRRVYPGFSLAAVADPDTDGVRRRLRLNGLDSDAPKLFPDAGSMLANTDGLDGLFIGTRCNLHAPLAASVAATGLPLYLEKPVGISWEQLVRLRDAYRGRERSVVVSFPMRSTPLFAAVAEVLESGRVGAVNQVVAVNNVPYGAEYYASATYRDHEVTGGLWLQKATHDFDYLNVLLGTPTMIAAAMSRKVYGGDRPHGLRCSACDISDTCVEGAPSRRRRGDDLARLGDHMCVFGERIRHQDAGSALVMYDGGAHASYTQNFVSRRSAATRGAVVTGHDATLSFDWYTESLRVVDHFGGQVEEREVRATTGHLGGDEALLRNFVDVCLGRDESRSDLEAGLLSAAMCLAARASAHEQRWLPVPDVRSPRFPAPSVAPRPTPADLEPVA